MGLILLGLWGMLALLLSASIGKETHFRADLKADLEPGFGETHATRPHILDEGTQAALHKDLLASCLSADCFGREDVVDPGYRDEPVDDGADDATSSIGRPGSPGGSPGSPSLNIAQGPFSNGLFIPGGGGNPNPGGSGNPGGPTGNPPDNPGTPQHPNDTPPPDFTQPPFSNPPGLDSPHGPGSNGPGPDGPGPNGPAPEGPRGPDGPPNGVPDKPIQIPEPLTLSLFATGVAGSVLLRRRKARTSK